MLDGKTLEKVAVVKTGNRARHLRFSADRKLLYVAASDSNRVDIIDVAALKVVDRLDVGPDPEVFDLSPDGKMMYVGNEDDAELTFFDMATRKKVGTVKVGAEPEGVLAHPNGKIVYVTSEVAHMVHVVEAGTRKIVTNVLVGDRPRRLALTPTSRSSGSRTRSAGRSASSIRHRTRSPGRSVSSRRDSAPMRSRRWVSRSRGTGRSHTSAWVGPTTSRWSACPTGRSRGFALVGKRPWNVLLSRDEKTLYVCNGLSDDLSVVDTATLKVPRSVPVGRVPYMAVVDD